MNPLNPKDSICILPKLSGLGGPTSFQGRLVQGLTQRGIAVHFNPADPSCRAILVIGGTKQLADIWQAKRRGVRIVQRLNGMNWIHRKRTTGLKHYLRSEYGNWNLSFIRRYFADHIVYQSQFARSWWQTRYRTVSATSSVIYNAVDLNIFTPEGAGTPPEDHIRLMIVEGHLGGGNEPGLENAARLSTLLAERIGEPVELMVVGDVPESLRKQIEFQTHAWISWAGVIPRDRIPETDRSAHLLFSADLNAACPNSVVEALACGLPVVAYATGSLPELIQESAGRVAPYGSNYWNLEPPVIENLVDAAVEVLSNLPAFRLGARKRAVENFGLDQMVESYLKDLLGDA